MSLAGVLDVQTRGDVVTQKQCFAIADTRAPVTATTLLPFFLHMEVHPQGNQILLVGLLQGACRLTSPGLHRVESASKSMQDVAQKTYVDAGWLNA